MSLLDEPRQLAPAALTCGGMARPFVSQGARPQGADSRIDSLNVDEARIKEATTARAKVIVAVQSAGVGTDMDTILKIGRKHGLLVVDDAAQGVNATYKGRFLGTGGHLGTCSFHEAKNFISGKEGALLVDDDRFLGREEVARKRGTNRSHLSPEQAEKHSWVGAGSFHVASEMAVGFVYAQLKEADHATEGRRRGCCRRYKQMLRPFDKANLLQLPWYVGVSGEEQKRVVLEIDAFANPAHEGAS